MSVPIYNPPMPFSTPIQKLHQGSMIYVTGTPTGQRFSINLKMGPHDGANNALHFNPRFNENAVVRNTQRGGQWGPEERQADRFPFFMGHQFEIIILCQQNQFKIAVNGQHFIEYRHRLPLQNISYLQIKGNVTLQMIRFDQEQPTHASVIPGVFTQFSNPLPVGFTAQQPLLTQPSQLPGCISYGTNPSGPRTSNVWNPFKVETSVLDNQPMVHRRPAAAANKTIWQNPAVPFVANLPYPNIRDRSVTIQGMPINTPPQRIMIDLQTGAPQNNVLFHFNPRLNDRVIVRNARFNNAWGPEERNLSNMAFPFQFNVPFQLVISVDRQSFKVTLNGMMVCQFPHRDRPLNKIKQLSINGSIAITQVQFN